LPVGSSVSKRYIYHDNCAGVAVLRQNLQLRPEAFNDSSRRCEGSRQHNGGNKDGQSIPSHALCTLGQRAGNKAQFVKGHALLSDGEDAVRGAVAFEHWGAAQTTQNKNHAWY